ncbi:DUF192 domain-containing protein [Geothrix sp. PMB-07]|uniref:DUF192 domain-containing protein n=1 Tax=Geothrix sp. PMB-07 TaxID=3068640 RepID=UPI002740A03A|nr:DUF192 domain-containing protein [Geothrix sp. PMB-07]WLT31767.1 DUF192 domain-containing protein [Geothrix sp. PMB-07]
MRRILLACFGYILVYAAGGGSVVIKAKVFMAEVAVTDREVSRGLMYRQTLAKDRCMVLLGGEEALRPLRTWHHLIALDVAWVDQDGQVVEVSAHTPPCRTAKAEDCPAHGGSVSARHVVEFPAGTFHRLGLKKGDRLGWELTLDDGRIVRGGQALPKSKRK